MTSFAKDLVGTEAKSAPIDHFENELKTLCSLKDFMIKKVELESKYARKMKELAVKAAESLGKSKPRSQSGIFDACLGHVEYFEAQAEDLERRSNDIQKVVNLELGKIITIKEEVKGEYAKDRDYLEQRRDRSMQETDAARKAYEEAAKNLTKVESKLKKSQGTKSEKRVQESFDTALLDLQNKHNTFVLQVAANKAVCASHEELLLPSALEALESLQKFLIHDVVGTMSSLLKAVDTTTPIHVDKVGILKEKIESITADKEYAPLCVANQGYTGKLPTINFECAPSQLSSSFHELTQGTVIVVSENRDPLEQSKTFLEKDYKDFNEQVAQEDDKIKVHFQSEDSASNLQKPATNPDERQEQLRAYKQMREHMNQRAMKQCSSDVCRVKSAAIAAALAGGASSGDGVHGSSSKSSLGSGGDGDASGALEDQSWYHGILARVKVQELLSVGVSGQPPAYGDFLVRESAKSTGQLVVSVFVDASRDKPISHFKVTMNNDDYFSFEGEAFPTVPELIEYHIRTGEVLTHKSNVSIIRGVTRLQKPFTHDMVDKGTFLGKGNFGDVYRGTIVQGRIPCAIKTCRETVSNPERFLEEADTLAQYDHPNIVKLYGVVKHTPIMILLELCEGGELLTFLRKHNDGIEVGQKVRMMSEAAAGLAYLHSRNCIHRDLAARNCLLTGEVPHVLKISDFGMSRINEDDEDLYTVNTTAKQIPIRWTAPEALEHLEYFMATDVWSFGILVWEVFSGGVLPYAGMNNAETREQVIRHNYRLSQPRGCPDAVYTIMQRTWRYRKEERPTMVELQNEIVSLEQKYPHDSEA
eukprot:m.313714 g.313714  ORF g.313714 m.313714 type:complete len:816 (+) comp20257_c0_seq2:205-2652(+)